MTSGAAPNARWSLAARIAAAMVVSCLLSVAIAWGSAATVDLWSNIDLQRHGTSDRSFPCWGVVMIEKPSAAYVFRAAITRPHTFGAMATAALSAVLTSAAIIGKRLKLVMAQLDAIEQEVRARGAGSR